MDEFSWWKETIPVINIEHLEDIVSVSRLDKNPGRYLNRARKSPVYVVRNNSLDAVLVGVETWAKIQGMLEDYFDMIQAEQVFGEPQEDGGKTIRDLIGEVANIHMKM